MKHFLHVCMACAVAAAAGACANETTSSTLEPKKIDMSKFIEKNGFEVEDGDVGALPRKRRERGLAVLHRADRKPLALKNGGIVGAQYALVLDQQNLSHGDRPPRPPLSP